jgi:nucleoside-diphosphate-sugar epimerase
MPIQNVVLVGADGKLGPTVLKALVSNGFTVTVLKRQSSKTPADYPADVKEVRVPDSFPYDALVSVLKGQDAVVVTTSGTLIDLQKNLGRAAAEAGVQRFIPADFGSVDSESENARKMVPLYGTKRDLRLYLQTLAEKHASFSWTAIVCGHFFDWSLDFMHIWVKTRTVDYLDGGNIRASASSLEQIAKATARILQHADNPETRNRILYIQSFCKTQVEVKEALERVTGEKWKVNDLESESFTREQQALMKEGIDKGTEQMVWILGVLEANWEKNDGFAMNLLGLEEEDLDVVVKAALEN